MTYEKHLVELTNKEHVLLSKKWVYLNVQCDRCNKALTPVYEEGHLASLQYENALCVSFSGGYGMFIDPILTMYDSQHGFDPDLDKILCKECAKDLLAWFGISDLNPQ